MITSKEEKGISVIICCYNSSLRIEKTLQFLSKQQIRDSLKFEIIVVDNASTDNTAEFAKEVWSKLNCSHCFSVVHQPIPGLSAARDKGYEVSSYSCLVFCDDDNWLAPEYIQLSFDIMEGNREIGILGGWNIAAAEITPPGWFEKFQRAYAVGKQGVESGDISSSKGYVFGAGAVVRKSILSDLKGVGFRSILSDRKGKELTCGGDNEWGYLTLMLGYKIWYDERLTLQHFIPQERLTWSYFLNLQKGVATSKLGLTPYQYYVKKDIPSSPSALWRSFLFYTIKEFLMSKKRLLSKNREEEGSMVLYQYSYYKVLLSNLIMQRSVFIANCRKIIELKKKLSI